MSIHRSSASRRGTVLVAHFADLAREALLDALLFIVYLQFGDALCMVHFADLTKWLRDALFIIGWAVALTKALSLAVARVTRYVNMRGAARSSIQYAANKSKGEGVDHC